MHIAAIWEGLKKTLQVVQVRAELFGGGPIEGAVEGEVQDGGLQAQGLFAQAKHEVDVLVHRGRLDHAVTALVQGNGLRITVAGVGSIRFEAIGFDFSSFTERHKKRPPSVV